MFSFVRKMQFSSCQALVSNKGMWKSIYLSKISTIFPHVQPLKDVPLLFLVAFFPYVKITSEARGTFPELRWASPRDCQRHGEPMSFASGDVEVGWWIHTMRAMMGDCCFFDDTPPKFNSSPLKNDGWKTTFLSEGLFWGAMLNFKEVYFNKWGRSLFKKPKESLKRYQVAIFVVGEMF